MVFISAVFGILAFFFVIVGLLFSKGKGGFLLAGWNTMSKEKKAQYDEKALLRFLSNFMFLLAVFWAAAGLLYLMGHYGAGTVLSLVSMVPLLFAVFYVNKSKRFRREDDAPAYDPNDPKELKKRKIRAILMLVILLGTIIPVGWLMWEGQRPVSVNVRADSLVIRGLYGTTLDFDRIADVERLTQPMSFIGAGRRRAGHATSNSWRGNFAEGQMHIQNPNEGPTIRITPIGDRPIFISKSNPNDTEALFIEIYDAWQEWSQGR